jgi:HEXXH motif-containing protein
MTRRPVPAPPATPSPEEKSEAPFVVDAAGLVVPAGDLLALKSAHHFYQRELLRETLRLSRRSPSDVFDSTPPLYDLLRHAAAKNPSALLDALCAPSVAPAVWCYARRERWPEFQEKVEAARRSMVPNLLLELAARDLLPEGGAAVSSSDDLASPHLGAVLKCREGAGGWRFKNGFVGVGTAALLRLSSHTLAGRRPSTGGLSTEMGYVPLADPICLALTDQNPIAQLEAHPDKAGNVLNLGGRSEEDWRSAADTAVHWVAEYWPELFHEMTFLLRQIVPVGFYKDRHLSASYREGIGTVYLSLIPNPMIMTEALIHEFQHNKLNMASYADPLLENAFSPLYASPLRPDPRPLWGILMGVHAFLPVAEILRKMRAAKHPAASGPAFEKRFSDIDSKNDRAMETLKAHGRWTPVGEKLLGALDALHARHRAGRST